MNVYRKVLVRKPVFTAAVILLLAAAIAFSSMGFSGWYAAGKQMDEVSSHYTSIAIPYNADLPGFMPGVSQLSLQSTIDMEELLAEAPVEVTLDRRVVLGAYIEGTTSLTTDVYYNYTWKQYDSVLDEPYNVAVLAVRCEKAELSDRYVVNEDGDIVDLFNAETYDSEGNLIETKIRPSYSYTFLLEDVLCGLEREFEFPEQVRVSSNICNEDGSAIFQEGHTYLIRGRYCYVMGTTDEGEDEEYGSFFLDNGLANSGLVEAKADGFVYDTPEDGILPLYAEYTGSLEEFLSGEGKVWEEEIIPAVELNYSAAKLMLTDNVDSMYWFNTGEASILDGRSITEEEYASGENICLVSLQYAEYNGLSVGDKLKMELYHPSINTFRSLAMDMEGNFIASAAGDATFLEMNPCYPENSLGIEKEYTIVGIYTAPVVTTGTFAFGADVIFAPKQSVPESSEFDSEGKNIPLLSSVMIKNGTAKDFESYLEELNLGGSFLYFDQGYSDMYVSIQEVSENALRLLTVSVLLFFITLFAVCFLMSHQVGKSMEYARRIGVSCRRCRRQAIAALLPLLLIGLLLGVAVGGICFRAFGNTFLSTEITYSVYAAALFALVQMLILLIGLLCTVHLCSHRKLLAKRR